MDETPRQLIGETRLPISGAPGRPARQDYEYRRCGTCNVFMASEPLAGTRMTRVSERRTKADWAHFLADIAERYADATRITLVMDNLSTHRPGALYETFDYIDSVSHETVRRVLKNAMKRVAAHRLGRRHGWRASYPRTDGDRGERERESAVR